MAPSDIASDMEWVASPVEEKIEKIEAKIEGEVKGSVEYVGSKAVTLEERAMYLDLVMHEGLRMLSTLVHAYDHNKSDLEWFAQIVLRELCKLEKATRKELSDGVQVGLVEAHNTKNIVKLRMQITMLGCIQQGLEEVENMESQQVASK